MAQAFGSVTLNVLIRHQQIWKQPFVIGQFSICTKQTCSFKQTSLFSSSSLSWILSAAMRPKSWSHTETPQSRRREIDCHASLSLPRCLQRKMLNGNRSHLMKHEWLKQPAGRACQTADTTPFFFYLCHPLFFFSWGQQTEWKERRYCTTGGSETWRRQIKKKKWDCCKMLQSRIQCLLTMETYLKSKWPSLIWTKHKIFTFYYRPLDPFIKPLHTLSEPLTWQRRTATVTQLGTALLPPPSLILLLLLLPLINNQMWDLHQ